jgi:mono/diheme cytochrome c family protein
MAFERVLVSLVLVPLLAVADPSARPSFDRLIVAEGARLAAIGNCASCHTAVEGKAYAGGYPLKTPFGTIYGTNITPDRETGIGSWSEAQFRRALREGRDREGRHLYPAFPYDHFTRLTDGDISALYAFLMTREPVAARTPPNDLSFPFNFRSLIGLWKLFFFEPGTFRPDPDKSAQWNRGAYLVEGLGHCGACHTPRNFLGAEVKRRPLEGGEAEGWHAPALTGSNPAPVPWTEEELFRYLRTGLEERHAIAAGPMQPVVRNLAAVSEDDVRAIAAYLAQFAGPPTPERQKRAQDASSLAERERASSAPAPESGGAAVYAAACATCHAQGRDASSGASLPLSLGTAMTVPTSANLVRITLEGIQPPTGESGRWMPAFATLLTDEQTRDLMVFIRAQYGGGAPPWRDIDEQIHSVRKALKGTE